MYLHSLLFPQNPVRVRDKSLSCVWEIALGREGVRREVSQSFAKEVAKNLFHLHSPHNFFPIHPKERNEKLFPGLSPGKKRKGNRYTHQLLFLFSLEIHIQCVRRRRRGGGKFVAMSSSALSPLFLSALFLMTSPLFPSSYNRQSEKKPSGTLTDRTKERALPSLSFSPHLPPPALKEGRGVLFAEEQ